MNSNLLLKKCIDNLLKIKEHKIENISSKIYVLNQNQQSLNKLEKIVMSSFNLSENYHCFLINLEGKFLYFPSESKFLLCTTNDRNEYVFTIINNNKNEESFLVKIKKEIPIYITRIVLSDGKGVESNKYVIFPLHRQSCINYPWYMTVDYIYSLIDKMNKDSNNLDNKLIKKLARELGNLEEFFDINAILVPANDKNLSIDINSITYFCKKIKESIRDFRDYLLMY